MSQTHISGDRLVELSTLANPTDGEAAHLRSCSQCEYERQQLGRLLEDASALATAASRSASLIVGYSLTVSPVAGLTTAYSLMNRPFRVPAHAGALRGEA